MVFGTRILLLSPQHIFSIHHRLRTMPKIEQTITIASPIDEVFAAIVAVEHSPAWISALKEIRHYSGPPRVGTTFVEIASFMGKTLETGKEVTVFEPPHRFVHKSTSGPVPQELSMTLEPVDGGTHLALRFEAEPNGFFGALPVNILVVAMEVLIKGNLMKLKGMVEGKG
jgi:uncharacterized protein YndB with AHSA1/START domain